MTDAETGPWEAHLAVEIRNPEPGPQIDEDAPIPETSRSARLYGAAIDAQEIERAGWPSMVVRDDDGYAEVHFLVSGESREAALRAAVELSTAALAEAEIEPGPMSVAVSTLEEGRAPDGDLIPGGDELDEDDDEPEVEPVAPDANYARAWWVEDELARGALKQSAAQLLEEIMEAWHDVQHGQPVGETFFAVEHLPDGFAQAYDERFLLRFHACLVIVGYKLAQDPAIKPGCLAEELALAVIVNLAAELLREQGASAETLHALTGVYEICEDDDVLDLFRMEEPADAAVHGHDPVSRELGKADMRVEAWFDPMWRTAGTSLHPICKP